MNRIITFNVKYTNKMVFMLSKVLYDLTFKFVFKNIHNFPCGFLLILLLIARIYNLFVYRSDFIIKIVVRGI